MRDPQIIPAQGDAGKRMHAALAALKQPEAPHRSAAPASSVYGRAAAAVPKDVHPVVHRSVLSTRLSSVAAQALLPGTSLVLVVVPGRQAADEALPLCRRLVEAGAVAVVLGPDLPRAVDDRSAVLTVPLRSDDSLAQEWGLIACGPARRVALLAHADADARDSWMWLSTRDSVAVHRAGTAILERIPFLRLWVPPLAEDSLPSA